MVELFEIQSAYYMVAATGVLVAAIYYIMNMRYNMKAREMEICQTFCFNLLIRTRHAEIRPNDDFGLERLRGLNE
jgi:hypothetical protein